MNLANAKRLRQNMTEAEQKLWRHLRGKRFQKIKFKRQKPIGPYIVDFVALKERLVIELDGSQHLEQQEYDQRRTKFLESLGYEILRFWDNECLIQTESVLTKIYQALGEQP